MRENYKHIIISIPFLAILFFVFINQNLGLINEQTNLENRNKIDKPDLNINRLDPFPKKYNNYFQDNFKLRNSFLSLYNYLNKYIFRNPIISKKYLNGDDDYLFELRMFIKESKRYSNEHLKLIENELIKRDGVFKNYGAQMYIFIVPRKQSIYKEKLPSVFSEIETNRSEILVKYLQENTNLKIFSLKDYLISKSDTADIFLKYDTHWNRLGAFWGYRYIVSKIAEDFPSIKTQTINDFYVYDTIRVQGNLSKNIGLELVDKQFIFKPKNKKQYEIVPFPKKYKTKGYIKYGITSIINKNKSLPKAIVIHDSFTQIMKRFMFNSFSQAYFLWDRWKYDPHYDMVEDYKPDLVLFILHEPGTDSFLPEELQNYYEPSN